MKDNPCIRIGHLKIIDHLILGIAGLQLKNTDICLTHSILEPVAMNSWNQICDSLVEGDINAAFITVPMAMELFDKGLDIRVLMFTHRSGGVMVRNKTAKIRNIADFKGKTILVSSQMCVLNMLLHQLFSSAGLTFGACDDFRPDVIREVISPFLMPEMLTFDHKADIAGFIVSDPYGTQAVKQGSAVKICTSQSLWKDHPGSVFVLKNSFIKHNSEAVKEIISLFVQTGQLIEKHKTGKIFSMAHDFLNQDKAVIQAALLKTGISFSPHLLIPDMDMLNMIQDYMADSMGELIHKISIHNLLDNSFILNLMPEDKK